jgi:imidazolonepropionase-like amidohydrolase
VKTKLGSITQGKWADIVAVEGNPEQDITVLEKKIKFVMKEGKYIYKNSLDNGI